MQKVSETTMATNARIYVEYWFKLNRMSAREASWKPNLISTIWLDYCAFFIQIKMRNGGQKQYKISRGDIDDALGEYIVGKLAWEMKTALLRYKCTKEDISHLENWVKAVTGSVDSKDVAVMAHWVWLIKRNGFSLSIKHQIMPVLYGPQGGGKTIALEHLIKPISDFRLTIGMNQLTDDRIFEGLANHFVVLFDELQGVERADMNALKKQITTIMNSYRKLYSHAVVNIPMRCSFVGATNKPINESFNDSTGMRRFWQINTLPKLDWDLIGKIDYEKLYKGIDENKPEGYLTGDQLSEVYKYQQRYVNKENIEEFVQEKALKAENVTPKLISQDELYDAYVTWAARSGLYKKLDLPWFARKLETRLAYRTVKTAKGHNKRVYEINPNSEIEPGLGTEKLLKESSDGRH